MTTMTRLLATAGLIVAGGALLAFAHEPAPGARAETPAAPVWRAGAERGDDHKRPHGLGHRRGGARGGPLAVFGPADRRALFATVDADGDGAVTQAEIDAHLDARIRTADADGDGALTLDEVTTLFAKRPRPRMADAFRRLDADGSGAVSAAEIDARFGALVARMDRNGDGALSREDRRRGPDRD